MKTDAQRKAQNKYTKSHYIVVGAKLKKETAAAFKAYAAAQGTTVNALISQFVAGCLQDQAQTAPADDQTEKTE